MAARKARPTESAERGVRGFAVPRDGRVERIRSQDGLSLAVRIFDNGDHRRLPLFCLPGLSRNSRDFLGLGNHFATREAAGRRVFAVDYRGRGLSDNDPDWGNYKPLVEAQDALAVAAAYGLERVILVGTSRGGIISMLLGALRPGIIAGVVLNDIGPIIDGRGLARIKQTLKSAGGTTVTSWNEAAAAIRIANEAQFPKLSDADWMAFAEAYFVETDGRLVPQFDPNLNRAIVDLDLSEKVPVLWPQFLSLVDVPVLAIRGENSDILSESTLDEMAVRHPRLETHVVEDQGHAPLLRDSPTLERIAAFASRCDG